MPPLDLFALAQENDDALAASLAALCGTLPGEHGERMGSFCRAVTEQGSVSVNMKPWKMRRLLHRERYPTIYEIAKERAAARATDEEDELRAMQGAYYERRVLFDRSFVDGERFLYGALNIGGAGVDYGVFCVVVAGEVTRPESTAFLPENSLVRYVRPAASLALDEAALRREVGSPAQRHSVAGLKHADDIARHPAPAWATMLCSGDRFVEAIFVGDVTPDRIAELRLKKDEVARLSDLAFEAMMGTLPAADRAELEDFQGAMATLGERGLGARVKEV